jgi:chromosome segregation ATPase
VQRHLDVQLADKTREVSSLSSSLQEERTKSKRLQLERDSLLEERNTLQQSLKEMGKVKSQIDKDLRSKIEEVIGLKTELSTHKFNLSRLKNEQGMCGRKRKQFYNLFFLLTSFSSSSPFKVMVEEKVGKLEKALKESERSRHDSEKQLSNMRKQTDLRWAVNINEFTEVKKQAKDFKAQVDLLNQTIESNQHEKEELLQQVANFRSAALAETETLRRKAQTDQQILVVDLERAMTDNRHLLQENESLRSMVKRLANENLLFQLKLADLDSQVVSLTTERLPQAEETARKLQNQLDLALFQEEEKTLKIKELQTTKSRLEMTEQELQTNVLSLETQYSTLREESRALEKKLEGTTTEHQTLIEQFENYVKFVCHQQPPTDEDGVVTEQQPPGSGSGSTPSDTSGPGSSSFTSSGKKPGGTRTILKRKK